MTRLVAWWRRQGRLSRHARLEQHTRTALGYAYGVDFDRLRSDLLELRCCPDKLTCDHVR